ncbi:expressed unknown protein [Seminavis robusta]|uniref:Uncharacterized protein n=1 Tax=Seminavis robusta TaxID=568900 RepID=A0A9N8HNR0_9STRA|nr:expressed unknown protein [Seminavis robusta]|eukprot:Sro842_g209700.1 n/a (718) ;mRNA; f:22758-25613
MALSNDIRLLFALVQWILLVSLCTPQNVHVPGGSQNIFDSGAAAGDQGQSIEEEFAVTGCWFGLEVENEDLVNPLDRTSSMDSLDRIHEMQVYTLASRIQRIDVSYLFAGGISSATYTAGQEDATAPDPTKVEFPIGACLKEMTVHRTPTGDRILGLAMNLTDGSEFYFGLLDIPTAQVSTFSKPGYIISVLATRDGPENKYINDLGVAYYAKPRPCGPCPMTYVPGSSAYRQEKSSPPQYVSAVQIDTQESDSLARLQVTYVFDGREKDSLHTATGQTAGLGDTPVADLVFYAGIDSSTRTAKALDCVDLYLYVDNSTVAGIGFCARESILDTATSTSVCRTDSETFGPYGIHSRANGISKVSTCLDDNMETDERRRETIFMLSDILTVNCPSYITMVPVAPLVTPDMQTATDGGLVLPATLTPTQSPTNSPGNPYTVEQLGGLSIEASGMDLLEGSPVTFQNTSCAIRYRHRPWGVGCKFNTQVSLGDDVDPLRVCGSICMRAEVQFNQEATGALAKFLATVTLWDDFGGDGADTSLSCQTVIDALGLTEPIEMELDLGNITYESVTEARDAVKRRPSRRRGVDQGDAIVTDKGEFAFGVTSIPPKPVAIPPSESTFGLPENYTLGVKDTTFQLALVNTGCGIVTSAQPWSVDCNATIRLHHGQAPLNGGQPLEMQIFATGVVDTRPRSQYLLSIRYGVRMPETSISYSANSDPI